MMTLYRSSRRIVKEFEIASAFLFLLSIIKGIIQI